MPPRRMTADSPLITLTTDFGTTDAYVPAMKGTMLSIAPNVRLVDVTHEISPQDVMESAFVLKAAQPFFPEGTIHLVVVDPGVGTERRAVALRHENHWYVGPDNGVFPLVLDGETPEAMVELDNPDVWRSASPSATFHGRDIFCPAAAHLAAGHSLEVLGSPIDTLEPLRWAQPITEAGTIQGWVVHIDHFGNCITNIQRSTVTDALDLNSDPPSDELPPLTAYAGSTVLHSLCTTYGDVPDEDPLLLFGSTDFLEVSVNGGNAAERLDIRKGDSIKLTFEDVPE